MGPEVNWKGWLSVFPNQLRFSARAQILFFDWKTKYLPSEVHWPQHSVGGGFQPGSNGAASLPDDGNLPQRAESDCSYPRPKIESASHPATRLHRVRRRERRKALVGAEPSLLAMTRSWPSP